MSLMYLAEKIFKAQRVGMKQLLSPALVNYKILNDANEVSLQK